MLQLADVSSVSFLSGCTVLSMSCYSIGKMVLSGEKAIDMKSKTPLAVGAAVGGVFGKQMFSAIKLCFAHEDAVTAVQSLCLAIITIGTLLYTLNKRKIRTHYLKSAAVCVMIGFLLGMSSSFLGIGGGPVNLVVLYFFSVWTRRPQRQIVCISFCSVRLRVCLPLSLRGLFPLLNGRF